MTVEGDRINRCEFFDEADLDAALARFDELSRPAPRLENAASQVYERFWSDSPPATGTPWREMLADDIIYDDRRRVVNAGIRHGRDAEIDELAGRRRPRRHEHDVGSSSRPAGIASSSLVPDSRAATSEPEAFASMSCTSSRSTPTNGSRRHVMFDLDDIDAAFEELDARYLAGEAAAHAHTWSVIADAYAAFNRHELPATTPDWVNIDHRRAISFRAR